MNQNILAELGSLPLENLAPIFNLLKKRCYTARLANNGRVPKEIFEACVGIGGTCPCYQVVVRVVDMDNKLVGFALRKREADESGDAWANMYHNICTVARMTETPDDILERIASDMGEEIHFNARVILEGVTIHSEKERCCDAHTHIWSLDVFQKAVSTFPGTWEIFGPDQLDDPRIIDHMREILKWVMTPNKPMFFRTMSEY